MKKSALKKRIENTERKRVWCSIKLKPEIKKIKKSLNKPYKVLVKLRDMCIHAHTDTHTHTHTHIYIYIYIYIYMKNNTCR